MTRMTTIASAAQITVAARRPTTTLALRFHTAMASPFKRRGLSSCQGHSRADDGLRSRGADQVQPPGVRGQRRRDAHRRLLIGCDPSGPAAGRLTTPASRKGFLCDTASARSAIQRINLESVPLHVRYAVMLVPYSLLIWTNARSGVGVKSCTSMRPLDS